MTSMLGKVTRAVCLYLAAGAVLTVFVGLLTERTQFSRHGGEGVSLGMVLAAAVAFVFFRAWVAVIEGTALVFALRKGLRPAYIIALGALLPVLMELALSSGSILDQVYYRVFSRELWISVLDLAVPILAGLCVSLWLLRAPRAQQLDVSPSG